MLSFLLHTANRNIKSEDDIYRDAFYKVKDIILKKYGTWDGYDVQHIKGKICNSCGGRGVHPKYGNTGKVYDYADCYHCWAGWYRLPKWICLRRVKFGPYQFHQPLKREECVKNPFTEESLGWKVTDRPVIEGYIDHADHWFGDYAIMILLWHHGYRDLAKKMLDYKFYWKKIRYRNWMRKTFRWQTLIVWKPRVEIKYYYDPDFSNESELPF